MDYSAFPTLMSEILISVIYLLIHQAKKKYFTKQNLLDLYHWALVILIPTPAAIPVLFSISPLSHIILIPYWVGVSLWILFALRAKMNREEKPLVNKVVIKMSFMFFSIGIFAHCLLQYLIGLQSEIK